MSVRLSGSFMALSILLRLAVAAAQSDDIGFEYLVTDDALVRVNVPLTCWNAPGLPEWVNGSFIVPSVAQFSIGGEKFQGLLDGFGKLHRFEMSNGRLCLQAKMMETGFYNKSIKKNAVAPGILFDETVPRRKTCRFMPMCNTKGPNDNTYVNTIQVSPGKFTTWTDSTTLNEIDATTLDVLGKWEWEGENVAKKHLSMLGSAHPLQRDGSGDYVMLDIQLPEGPGSTVLKILTIPESDPHNRQLIYQDDSLDATPYFHSFGVTPNYVVLGFTPMTMTDIPILLNEPMIKAFKQVLPLETTFRVVPFDNGTEVRDFKPDKAFTYNHIVNVFENATGIVFDAVTWQDAALWLVAHNTNLGTYRNKTARDAYSDRQVVYRYVLHFDDGSVTSEPLSVENRITEFPKINMDFSTKPYCIYYATEQFHNDLEYGSMAIVKHNICTGQRTYWSKPNYFVSEPFFVSHHTKQEDDGMLVFTALNGQDGMSYFVAVNGSDISKELVTQDLPERITFTTHGEFFEGLLTMTRG